MIVELNEKLRLSKFKTLTGMMKNDKIIKVNVNGKLYDISKITDEKDMTILEID